MSDDRTKINAIEEMRFRLLIDAVVDYAIYMIDPDGIITSWNAGAKRFKGYEEAEILGSISRVFIPKRTARPVCLSAPLIPPFTKGVSRAKAGGFARTARISGPTSSSIPFAIRRANCWVLPRSPGI